MDLPTTGQNNGRVQLRTASTVVFVRYATKDSI